MPVNVIVLTGSTAHHLNLRNLRAISGNVVDAGIRRVAGARVE